MELVEPVAFVDRSNKVDSEDVGVIDELVEIFCTDENVKESVDNIPTSLDVSVAIIIHSFIYKLKELVTRFNMVAFISHVVSSADSSHI